MTSWSTPHSERPSKPWYHPVTLLWLAIDILYLLVSYIRQKRHSFRARRWALEMQITQSMQQTMFIVTDESLPLRQRQNALRTLRKLKRMSEELNIENDAINDYIEGYEEYKDIL